MRPISPRATSPDLDGGAAASDGWAIVTADAAFADPVYRRHQRLRQRERHLARGAGLAAKGVGGKLYYERNDLPLANRLFAERVLHRGPAAKPADVAALAARAR